MPWLSDYLCLIIAVATLAPTAVFDSSSHVHTLAAEIDRSFPQQALCKFTQPGGIQSSNRCADYDGLVRPPLLDSKFNKTGVYRPQEANHEAAQKLEAEIILQRYSNESRRMNCRSRFLEHRRMLSGRTKNPPSPPVHGDPTGNPSKPPSPLPPVHTDASGQNGTVPPSLNV